MEVGNFHERTISTVCRSRTAYKFPATGRSRMTRRQVPIDWLDLEMAFETHLDDSSSCLDLRTGKVHFVPTSSFDEDTAGDGEVLTEEAADAGLAEGWLLLVEPLESHEEYDWMVQFAGSVEDSRLGELLEVALDGRGAFRRFKDVLSRWPKERERWYAFRDECLRNAMFEWLAAHEIEPTTAPPRRPR